MVFAKQPSNVLPGRRNSIATIVGRQPHARSHPEESGNCTPIKKKRHPETIGPSLYTDVYRTSHHRPPPEAGVPVPKLHDSQEYALRFQAAIHTAAPSRDNITGIKPENPEKCLAKGIP